MSERNISSETPRTGNQIIGFVCERVFLVDEKKIMDFFSGFAQNFVVEEELCDAKRGKRA